MQLRLSRTIAVSMLGAISATANAGGLLLYEFGHPLQGASNAGEGAYARDASTAFFNPAGIMRLEQPEAMATLLAVYTEAEFEQESGTTVPGGNGGDAGDFAPGAAFFYARPVNDKYGFGFAFGAISGAVLDFDPGFVGRYWVEKTELLVVSAEPSVAYRLNDQWSVSLGVPLALGRLDLDVAIPPLTNLAMGMDGRAEVSDGTDFQATLAAGVLWEPTSEIRVGLTYFGELDFAFDSDLDITLPAGITLPQVSADVELPLVQTVRLSGAVDVSSQLTLLATLAWEDWSALDSVFISTNLTQSALPRNWDDVWHLALGMEWGTGGPWTYHAGIAYDSDPTSESRRTADLPVDRQVRLSGGARYRFANGHQMGGVLTYADLGDARIDNGDQWGQVVGEFDENYALFLALNYSW